MAQVVIKVGKYQALDGNKYVYGQIATLEDVEAARAIECNVAEPMGVPIAAEVKPSVKTQKPVRE